MPSSESINNWNPKTTNITSIKNKKDKYSLGVFQIKKKHFGIHKSLVEKHKRSLHQEIEIM